VSLQQHQNSVSNINSQGLRNPNIVDGVPLRRTSTNARSPAKIPHEQPEQHHPQTQQQPQQQLQQQQQAKQQQHKVEAEHDQAVSDTIPDQQDKKRKLVGS
jgi:hypothetical protein